MTSTPSSESLTASRPNVTHGSLKSCACQLYANNCTYIGIYYASNVYYIMFYVASV